MQFSYENRGGLDSRELPLFCFKFWNMFIVSSFEYITFYVVNIMKYYSNDKEA
jgi:hypothetical protein